MGYFEDLYSKKEQEKEELKEIQEQEDIKLMLQKYNNEVIKINRLIKAIIDKINCEPPDSCDWIRVNLNEQKRVVAWLIYSSYNDEGRFCGSTFLLPDGRLVYGSDGKAYTDDAVYLKHTDYVEGLSLTGWEKALPFYYYIVKKSYGNSLRRKLFDSTIHIFGIDDIDEDGTNIYD